MQDDEPTPMALRVRAIDDVARDVRRFQLVPADAAEPLPAFAPGAHVKVETPAGIARRYSLCNAPARSDCYEIAVKREPESRGGSRSLHEDVAVGDVLQVSPPENAFPLVEGARAYLFIAGGIGITPMLSMIETLGEDVPWKLYYLNRDPEGTPFADPLNAYGKRVVVHHTRGDSAARFDLWPVLEKPNTAELYCCGSRALMESVRDMTGHWSTRRVHFESFADGETVRPDDHAFKIRLAKSGLELDVPVGRSILSVVREHGCRVASSCESGTCGTCRVGLLAGDADHRDMVLMPEERGSQIMVCVSRAKSESLELDL